MLVDSILSYPSSPIAQEMFSPTMHKAWREFGARLQQAQRFVLSREVVQMTLAITDSSPKRWLSALNVCRLPFPKIFVEFSFADRVEWQRGAEARGMVIATKEGAPPPTKLGFLLEQMDDTGQDICVSQCWIHPDGSCSICHLSFCLKTSPDLEIDERLASETHKAMVADAGKPGSWTSKWIHKADEVSAAAEMEQRISVYMPDFVEAMWSDLALKISPEKLRELYSLAEFDLRSEWRWTVALLTLLNSRNIVKIDDAPSLVKLNKARLKSKKKPLLEVRPITMHLSKVQRNRLGTVGSGRDVAPHLVRGHLKLRGGKVFWWSPHIRGAKGPEQPSPRTYIVVP